MCSCHPTCVLGWGCGAGSHAVSHSRRRVVVGSARGVRVSGGGHRHQVVSGSGP